MNFQFLFRKFTFTFWPQEIQKEYYEEFVIIYFFFK